MITAVVPASALNLERSSTQILPFDLQYYQFLRCASERPQQVEDVLSLRCGLQQLLHSKLNLTKLHLEQLCRQHSLRYTASATKLELGRKLLDHECLDACQRLFYIFGLLQYCAQARQSVAHLIANPRSRHVYSTIQRQPDADVAVVQEDHKLQALRLPTASDKLTLINEWKSEFSDHRYTPYPCLVCSTRVLGKDMHLVNRDKLTEAHLVCLQNPALPEALFPQGYCRLSWHHAIVDMRAQIDIDNYSMCDTCHKHLFRKGTPTMPPLALANDLYHAWPALPPDVRDHFHSMTAIEQHVIASARAKVIHFKLSNCANSSEFGKNPSITSSFVKGNTIILPQNTVEFTRTVPMTALQLADSACILFVGANKPTIEELRKMQPLIISHSRTHRLLCWLINEAGNEAYKNLRFDAQSLREIASNEEGLPGPLLAGLVSTRATEAQDDYTTNNITEGPGQSDTNTFAHVAYVDLPNPTETNAQLNLKLLALKHLKTGHPTFMIPTSGGPINEWNNPQLLSAVWPHLDPWGISGFGRPRRKAVSLKEHVRHLINRFDDRFVTDCSFAYILSNIIRRQLNVEHIRWSVKDTYLKDFEDLSERLSAEVCDDLETKLKENASYKPANADEAKAFKVLNQVRLHSAHLNGSDGKRIQFRNEIQSMIFRYGLFNLFITVNPYDKHDPIMLRLAGKDVNLWKSLDETVHSAWSRLQHAAQRPDLAALFFAYVSEAFLEIFLKHNQTEEGFFGHTLAYHGDCENQGRSTYHMHLVVWLRDHLSPDDLKERLSKDVEYRNALFAWIEEHIRRNLPGQKDVLLHADPYKAPERAAGTIHPCIRERPALDLESDVYLNYMIDLVNECQYHTHGPTCIKGRKARLPTDDNCRMRIDGSTSQETVVGLEGIILKRLHPRINDYNETVLYCLRCNMDISYVGSGDMAAAVVYYITNYVTKSNIPMHVGFAALRAALSRIQNGEAEEPLSAKQTLIRCVNQIIGKTELCAPQVMRYLNGHEDRYCSDTFAGLKWHVADRYVRDLENSAAAPDSGFVSSSASPGVESERFSDVLPDPDSGNFKQHSQIIDYVYRPTASDFNEMSLYEFVGRVRVTKDSPDAGSGTTSSRSTRTALQPDHPLFESHSAVIRMKPRTVLFYGSSIPLGVKGSSKYTEFARAMLILHKPWRSLQSLLGSTQDWTLAFEAEEFPTARRQVIRNCEDYYKAQDAARKHQSRLRSLAAQRLHDTDLLNAVQTEEGGALPQDLWTTILLQQQLLKAEEAFGDENDEHTYDSAHNGGIRDAVYAASILNRWCEQEQRRPNVLAFQGILRETNEPDRYTKYKAIYVQMRVLSRTRGMPLEVSDDSSDGIPLRPAFLSRNTTLACEANRAVFRERVTQACQVVCAAETLNSDQRRVLYRVGKQIWDDTAVQGLNLFCSGVGGTGKTRVINAIKSLLSELGLLDTLVLAAPTGAAAILIGGNTLHFACNMRLGVTKPNVTQDTRNLWRNRRFMIIDEVSMMSASLLWKVHNFLNQVGPGPADMPFGNMNMLFFGDFGQLMPVQEAPVFTRKYDVQLNPSAHLSTREQETAQGAYLWQKVSSVIILKENWRQKSDPQYAGILGRIREGHSCKYGHCDSPSKTCNQVDFEKLLSRSLESANGLPKSEWATFAAAPIIVGTKSIRDALNEIKVKHHAKVSGVPWHYYYCEDRSSGRDASVPLTEAVQIGLSRLPANRCEDALGKLPLAIGIPVMLLENRVTDQGLVNGSIGILQGIEYKLNSRGKRVATCAFIRFDTKPAVPFPGCPDDCFPILPSGHSLNYQATGHDTNIGFHRDQLPILPAYSYVDYKSQGQTIKSAIVDINSSQSLQSVYVMLSRVGSLKHIAILRDFEPHKLRDKFDAMKRRSGRGHEHGLHTELKRLETQDALDRTNHAGEQAGT